MADFAFRSGKALTNGLFGTLPSGGQALARYGLAPALVALAFAARALLAPVLEHDAPFLFFVPAVLAASGLGGVGPGVIATGLGLVLGLLEAFAAGYLSSQYKDAVAFLVILIVLLAMPRGLFGRAPVERV